MGGEPCAYVTSEDGGGREAEHHLPIHITQAPMFKSSHDGGGYDYGEGGADRDLDIHFEEEHHRGNHHDAAADAEKAAGDAAGDSNDSGCGTEISRALAEPFTEHAAMFFAESVRANQFDRPPPKWSIVSPDKYSAH